MTQTLDLLEHTLISVEIIDGIKHIHYYGYAYFTECDVDTPYRWIDYTWLVCPLDEAVTYGISKWESDNQDSVKQYIEDCSEERLDEIFHSNQYPVINDCDITQDIPCGMYYIDSNEVCRI